MSLLNCRFDRNEIICPKNDVCNKSRVMNVLYIQLPSYFYKTMQDEEKTPNSEFQKPVHQLLRRFFQYYFNLCLILDLVYKIWIQIMIITLVPEVTHEEFVGKRGIFQSQSQNLSKSLVALFFF